MFVPTEEIIYEYLRAYLKERGKVWRRPIRENVADDAEQQRGNARQIEYRKKVCQSLNEISDEIRGFIMRSHNDKFREMMNSVGSRNPSYDDFKTMADELFAEGVTWFKIVTFLVFGAELACRAMNLGTQKDDEEASEEMVSHVNKCLSKYIDENLMQWISNQDNGWMNIKEHTLPGSSNDNKGMRYYFRMATFAAFVGGLYFCSRFILQK